MELTDEARAAIEQAIQKYDVSFRAHKSRHAELQSALNETAQQIVALGGAIQALRGLLETAAESGDTADDQLDGNGSSPVAVS